MSCLLLRLPFAMSIPNSRGGFALSAAERGESLNSTVLRLLKDAVGVEPFK